MWTKEERAEYMKKYREEHRDQLNANKRYWYKQNRERLVKKQREAYTGEKREKHLVYIRAYYEKHKDDPEYKARNRENQRRWQEKNSERLNAYKREQYRAKKGEEYVRA